MFKTIVNIITQALNPKRFWVMLKKVWLRLFDKKGKSKETYMNWYKDNAISYEDFANKIDSEMWKEAKKVADEITSNAKKILEKIPYNLGGGGAYPFLYFLVRWLKPKVIVETGVAAGFSSYSFLKALKDNGAGLLYSSDFPYFRIKNPEQYIGVIVPNELKKNWKLFIEGDENNLPAIAREIESIDILHYDSDKSYLGREKALNILKPKLKEDSVIIFDDIQDNSHFMDFVQENNIQHHLIFEFEGKYVGAVGKVFAD